MTVFQKQTLFEQQYVVYRHVSIILSLNENHPSPQMDVDLFNLSQRKTIDRPALPTVICLTFIQN